MKNIEQHRPGFEAWHLKHFGIAPHRAKDIHGGRKPGLEYWSDFSNASWAAWIASKSETSTEPSAALPEPYMRSRVRSTGHEQYVHLYSEEQVRALLKGAEHADALDAEQVNEMRIALTVQLDSLIDLGERYASRIKRFDADESRYAQGAIDHARKVAAPYKYNGKYGAAIAASTSRRGG